MHRRWNVGSENIFRGLSLKPDLNGTIYIKAQTQFELAAFSRFNPAAVAGRCTGAPVKVAFRQGANHLAVHQQWVGGR